MSIYMMDRDSVERQTLQNLVEAGIVEVKNAQSALTALRDLDPKDLLAVMLESHIAREAVADKKQYFPIDYASIGQN